MHSEPTQQTQKSRSSSKSSTKRAQRRSSSPRPETTQLEQDAITPIPPPVATQSQPSRLQGVEDLQNLPPDTLKNKYGTFEMQRGVEERGTGTFDQSYSTKIGMTPNWRTRNPKSLMAQGSDIDFVQVVRSGTGDNWKTTAKDHGYKTDESGKPIDPEGKPIFAHRAELTEQETGTGWRVDQSMYDTPFHSEAHLPITPEVGRHHLLKENETARLEDKPTIAGPGYKFDAMSTAMDKKTGKEFGTVEWGFNVDQNDQGESILRDRPPTLLEDNLKLDGKLGEEAKQRNLGRIAAHKQWNRAASRKEQANKEEAKRRKEAGSDRPGPSQQVTRIPRKGSTSTN